MQQQHEKVIIIDFGSQYTQLIARRVRELNVYSEIIPYNRIPDDFVNNALTNSLIKGIILSGSNWSVHTENSPRLSCLNDIRKQKLPILGICYGAQLLAYENGATVVRSQHREYGRAVLHLQSSDHQLFDNDQDQSVIWMSHGDSIVTQQDQDNIEVIAKTDSIPVAAFRIRDEETYGIQFHCEVSHTASGAQILQNFLTRVCKCSQDWTPSHFIQETVDKLKQEIGTGKVVLALSGGVDSSVAGMLLKKAIGDQLHCIFVDNGLLRLNEFEQVLEGYKEMGLNIKGVEASQIFYDALKEIADPELKRKAIGRTFIEIFDREAHSIQDVKYLAQGTIYPDVVESVGGATIKSHHNVGGLPEQMNLKVVEPLRLLFKDEVRRVGSELGIPDSILHRHPFPGPGLAIRIISDVTEEKVRILQQVDHIFINGLKTSDLYSQVWQAGAILLPVQSVGVMGDERSYENVIALRAVTSVDGMTADFCHLPYEFLARISNQIINQVKGVNRVVYDISSKPPATIEWE
jgi:GMP synthase (glutamine-hydrolysing)